MENAFIRKLTEIIETNLGDPRFGVDELARIMNVSYSSLRRRISTYTGKSASQFIREIRLRKAFDILQQEEVTIAEAAYRTGFSSPNYFNTCFHEHFGYPPGELRKAGMQRSEEVREVIDVRDVWVEKSEKRVKLGAGRMALAGIAVFLVLAVALFIASPVGNRGKMKSIAVLPIRNYNRDGESQRFCDGLQDQLQNDLHNQKALKVRPRVSADKYKNPGQLMPEIGKELNADYIILCSVSREGDLYRIWAYLIDARKDIQLWAQDFSRHKEQNFILQTEVVRGIINSARSVLLHGQDFPIVQPAGRDSVAASLLQQGKSFSDLLRFKPKQALEIYLKAVQQDSGLAGAYLGIAFTLNSMYADFEGRRDSMIRESRNAVDQAQRINPDLPEAHHQLGLCHYVSGDFAKALEECEISLGGDPDSPEVLYTMAGACMALGQWKKAEDCMLRVIEKNPYSALHLCRLGEIFDLSRDFTGAKNQYSQVIALNPVYGPAIFGLVDISLKAGIDPDKARALMDSLAETGYPNGFDSLRLDYQYVILDLYEGNYRDAITRLARWKRVIPIGPPWYCRPKYLLLAMAYGYLKIPDLERQYFDSTRIFLEGLQQGSSGNLNDPRVMSALGIAQAGLGLTGQAIASAEKVIELLDTRPDARFGTYAMEDAAYICTRTGNFDRAISMLRQLLADPGPLTVRLLELDPRWEPLGGLPEYKRLLKEYAVD